MYRKQMVIVFAAVFAAGLAGIDRVQGQTTPKATNPTLGERLDNFGHSLADGSLFDGVFGRSKAKQPAARRPQTTRQTPSDDELSPRAGSAMGSATAVGRSSAGPRPQGKRELFSVGNDRFRSETQPGATGATATPSPRPTGSFGPVAPSYEGYSSDSTSIPSPSEAAQMAPIRRPPLGATPLRRSLGSVLEPPAGDTPQPAGSFGGGPSTVPSMPAVPSMPTASPGPVIASTPTTGGIIVPNTTLSEKQPAPQAATVNAPPSNAAGSSTPLHERLAKFRQSVFGATTPPSATATPPTSSTPAPVVQAPAATGQATLAPVRRTDETTSAPSPSQAVTPTVEETGPSSPAPVDGPSLTKQTPTLAPRQPGQSPSEATPDAVARDAATPDDLSPTALAESAKVAAGADASSAEEGHVLLARRSPVLNVRTLGPARIAVGKQATYEVYVENQGDVAADGVVVTMSLPDWADVAGREATSGAILPEPAPGGGMQLLWKVGPMEAKSQQKATLAIVPRQSRAIDLAVRWDFTPAVSQTVIEVEEPRLAMRLAGPREVRFGEPQVFKLEIGNSGNGAADDVVLTLMPLVPGEGGPTQHRLGRLGAGQQKVIDMELTARQPGSLAVQMELRCDGPATASLNERLLVRKANVEVAIDAPKMQFTGTVATYRVRVRNSGNLTAEKVRLVAKIPPEAKLVAADGHGKASTDGQSVEWQLDPIAEGAQQELTLQCRLAREGYTQLKVDVVGDKVAAEATAVTRVESIADLALSVKDPSGPVPVGQKADFTITVHNRGTKDASGVEAVVYFSQGVEPLSAEGSHSVIRPGQVAFDSIGLVPAGKKVTMKIVAQAQTPGSHMFRAEVYCRPLGTKLVSEETTRFYQGEMDLPGAGAEERPMLGTSEPAPTQEPVPQTADRRNEPAGPAQTPAAEPSASTEATPMRY